MRKIGLLLAVLSAILLPTLHAAPAHATNYHSWVSHSGLDTNDCTAASPCATFAHALTQTYQAGDISCVDSGSFDQFTVTFAVTIDCSGAVAAPSADTTGSCTDGIVINAPGKVVTLRGLNVSGLNPCETNGILITAAAAVYIEDCVIENWPQRGILDGRATGATKLAIKNTTIRNNSSAGIVAVATGPNAVVLENVHSVGNSYGIAVANGNNVVISRSVFSVNGVAGIEADPGAQVAIDNTEISHNAGYGVEALGTVVLANSDIFFNASSISGPTLSYGNNRLFGNGGGVAPTPSGGASPDFGQQ